MPTPFRADQVGSLLRPPEVLAARETHEQGITSLEQLREVEDKAILQSLEMFRSVGIENIQRWRVATRLLPHRTC